MTNEQLAVLLHSVLSRLESAIDKAHNNLLDDDFAVRERITESHMRWGKGFVDEPGEFVLLDSLRCLQWELEKDVEALLASVKPKITGK